MGLGNYVTASNAAARELECSLTDEDVKVLAGGLESLGLPGWLQWKDENAAEVADYVRSTPSQRERTKRWREADLRRRLVLASVFHCRAAADCLFLLARHAEQLLPGGPQRDTTSAAGMLYFQLMDTEIPEWPEAFGQICPSPFPD